MLAIGLLLVFLGCLWADKATAQEWEEMFAGGVTAAGVILILLAAGQFIYLHH